MTLHEAISTFGLEAKSKLSNPVASGAPEDQLRAPLETLVADLAELAGLRPGTVVMVGETSLADIKTRPDYAVTRAQRPDRLHRGQGAGEGSRPLPLSRPARPGAVGEAPDSPEPRLHGRQRIQPLAQRRARRGGRSVGGRRGDRRQQARRPRRSRVPVRRLLPVGAAAAPVGQGACRHHRPSLPAAARRGDGAVGARLALAHETSRRIGASSCFRARRTKPSRTATRRRSPSGF